MIAVRAISLLRGLSTGTHLARIAARELVALGDERFTWGDAVLLAAVRGRLAALERGTRLGAAAAAEAEPPGDEVAQAGREWRRRRRLLAADELAAWLARWALDREDWHGYVQRTVAAARAPAPVPDVDLEIADADTVAVDAICSGELERWGDALAADVALAAGLREDGVSTVDSALAARLLDQPAAVSATRAAELAAIAARADAAREAVVSDAAVSAEVAARRLEWLQLVGDVLELGDEDVAREAAQCARVDGLPLAEVAVQAGGEVRVVASDAAAAGSWVTAAVGAEVGAVVGPIRDGASFLVVHVRERREPRADDPDTRRRAREALVARAERRALSERVTWYGGL